MPVAWTRVSSTVCKYGLHFIDGRTKLNCMVMLFLWSCCVRHEILPIYDVVSIKSIYFIKCFSISHIGAIGLCTVTAVNVILDEKLSDF